MKPPCPAICDLNSTTYTSKTVGASLGLDRCIVYIARKIRVHGFEDVRYNNDQVLAQLCGKREL
jgi:hypothetical protein